MSKLFTETFEPHEIETNLTKNLRKRIWVSILITFYPNGIFANGIGPKYNKNSR